MNFLIGIDGGGTHSRLLAVRTDGTVIGAVTGSSTNVESNEAAVVRQNVLQLLDELVSTYRVSLDDCAALCIGTAGVDTRSSRRKVEEMIESFAINIPYKVVNDAVIGLYANTQGNPGIMLIAGTGSIAYGLNRKRDEWRVGGYGYMVSDEGSAYWVAKEGIARALKSGDRSGPPTRLADDFCKALGLGEIVAIMDFVYRANKSDIASLSHLVTAAHKSGDDIAGLIMREAADALCRLVLTVIEQLNMDDAPYPLLLGGGFLLACDWLMTEILHGVREKYPLITTRKMLAKAEWGAVFMAAELAGVRLPQQDLDPSHLRFSQ